MTYLKFAEIEEVVDAALETGVINQPRALLMADIDPAFVGTLVVDPVPLQQMRLDLNRMNKVERLVDGSVPLALYLRNAGVLSKPFPQSRLFQDYASRIGNACSGVPMLATLTQLPAQVLAREAIIQQDDTVDFAFVERCLKAASRVLKVVVPRFEQGQQKRIPGSQKPVVYTGTAWLLSQDLLMTNHHVVNARSDGEANADPADFDLQGGNTEVLFDYDAAQSAVAPASVVKVEAHDEALDYCVLRLSKPCGREGLLLAADPVVIRATTALALNVIQHPRGQPKRFAIRNNLAVDADTTVIRYYTDTDHGSSGSPVCDDAWTVVALHRGAMLHNAKFQGQDTAFVNVGTQISSIITDLKARFAALAAELKLS